MCSYCFKEPCDSRCPNYEENVSVAVCCNCGGKIHVGEIIIEIDGCEYCEECISDMTRRELVEMIGGSWKEAERVD